MNNDTQYFDIIPYRAATALNLFAKSLVYVDSYTNQTVDLRTLPRDEFFDKVQGFLNSSSSIFNDDSTEQNQIDINFASKTATNTFLNFDLDLAVFGKLMLRNRFEEFIAYKRNDLLEKQKQLIDRAHFLFNQYSQTHQENIRDQIDNLYNEVIASGNLSPNNASPLVNLIHELGKNDGLYQTIKENYALYQICHNSSNTLTAGHYDNYCLEIATDTANKLFHWLYVSITSSPNAENIMTSLGVKYVSKDVTFESLDNDNLVGGFNSTNNATAVNTTADFDDSDDSDFDLGGNYTLAVGNLTDCNATVVNSTDFDDSDADAFAFDANHNSAYNLTVNCTLYNDLNSNATLDQ
jgi:hypothetical protein